MNLIEVLIIFITFLIALIEKFSKKPIYERKGILKKLKIENVAVLLLGILLLFQIFESIDNFNRESENSKNVKEIKDCMESATEDLKNTYGITVAMSDSLGKINDNSIKLIDNYRKAIDNYEVLVKKIDDLNKQTEQDIIRNKAFVSINGHLNWVKKTDSLYTLSSPFFNFGQRFANKFKYFGYIFQIDKNFNYEGFQTSGPIFYEQFPANSLYDINEYNLDIRKLKDSYIVVIFKYSYNDSILKGREEFVEGWIWMGEDINGNQFSNNQLAKDIGEKLMKEKKLTF